MVSDRIVESAMFARLIAASAFVAAACASAANAETFNVLVDQTVTLKLAAPANSVVVGNASVVDVEVYDPRTLLVTGKGFGSTNILVLDNAGRTVYSNMLSVSDNRTDQLTIVRGDGNYTYSCTDRCRGTPMVGDSPDHFQEVMTTVEAMQGAAKGN